MRNLPSKREGGLSLVLILASWTPSCGGGGGGPGVGDPLAVDQWHLQNTGQEGGVEGEDAGVFAAWERGYLGSGVRIAVVDDGLELAHPDLAPNIVPGRSFDYRTGGEDPTGGAHGTCCAGVAAAAANDLGGRGAAPSAQIVGYNLLQEFTSSNQSDAMVRGAEENWVSSNSWGAEDDNGYPDRAPAVWFESVVQGVNTGRGGKGLVYVWSAGNGGSPTEHGPIDDSNLDGWANHPFVITVAAVGDDGKKATYSETGANILVAAPSMGRADHGITTVDRSADAGYNDGSFEGDYADPDYTRLFNGTSSSTPLVAGVTSLVLQANAELSWRDVRLILARSARQNDPGHAGWRPNGAGHALSHEYGFGVVDAKAAVELATSWTPIGPLESVQSPLVQPGVWIPDADPTGVEVSFQLGGTGITRIEYVQLLLDVPDHTYSGDLEVVLTSPAGTESVLARPHPMPNGGPSYSAWVFSTVHPLDEQADGIWRLVVRDVFAQDTGFFNATKLLVAGH